MILVMMIFPDTPMAVTTMCSKGVARILNLDTVIRIKRYGTDNSKHLTMTGWLTGPDQQLSVVKSGQFCPS